MWAAWVLLLCCPDYCRWFGTCAWPSVVSVTKPCLVWRLPATAGWDWVTRCLAPEPREILELVVAHWWAEPGSGMDGTVLDVVLAWWFAGLIPDMADCGVWHIPNLVSAHWWVRLDLEKAGWRVQGVSELVQLCCWVRPGPRPSDEKGCVSGQLWVQGS